MSNGQFKTDGLKITFWIKEATIISIENAKDLAILFSLVSLIIFKKNIKQCDKSTYIVIKLDRDTY